MTDIVLLNGIFRRKTNLYRNSSILMILLMKYLKNFGVKFSITVILSTLIFSHLNQDLHEIIAFTNIRRPRTFGNTYNFIQLLKKPMEHYF